MTSDVFLDIRGPKAEKGSPAYSVGHRQRDEKKAEEEDSACGRCVGVNDADVIAERSNVSKLKPLSAFIM